MAHNNYFPEREKSIEIPTFLSEKAAMAAGNVEDYTTETAENIKQALEVGVEEKRNNMYHLKELDRATDAYTEEEAKVVIKRLVSNYPDLILSEVADLIKDMQELSGVILKNSKIFANKRGEV